ncbi:MAG: hypothetical protein H0V53_12400 [Rubrobacter sp.]|nr:hypothetical protein [Rubrobacter sp.]
MTAFKQLSRGGAFCGVPLGMSSVNNWLAAPAFGEALSLALVVGAFAGAGVWMFRSWGGTAQAPDGPSPEVATEPRREREPVTS